MHVYVCAHACVCVSARVCTHMCTSSGRHGVGGRFFHLQGSGGLLQPQGSRRSPAGAVAGRGLLTEVPWGWATFPTAPRWFSPRHCPPLEWGAPGQRHVSRGSVASVATPMGGRLRGWSHLAVGRPEAHGVSSPSCSEWTSSPRVPVVLREGGSLVSQDDPSLCRLDVFPGGCGQRHPHHRRGKPPGLALKGQGEVTVVRVRGGREALPACALQKGPFRGSLACTGGRGVGGAWHGRGRGECG